MCSAERTWRVGGTSFLSTRFIICVYWMGSFGMQIALSFSPCDNLLRPTVAKQQPTPPSLIVSIPAHYPPLLPHPHPPPPPPPLHFHVLHQQELRFERKPLPSWTTSSNISKISMRRILSARLSSSPTIEMCLRLSRATSLVLPLLWVA